MKIIKLRNIKSINFFLKKEGFGSCRFGDGQTPMAQMGWFGHPNKAKEPKKKEKKKGFMGFGP
jgi:hypothetical protein